jgi:hypothetical protein
MALLLAVLSAHALAPAIGVLLLQVDHAAAPLGLTQ